MSKVGEIAYKELVRFNKSYNKGLSGEDRDRLNLVIPTSILFAYLDHLLLEVCEKEEEIPFDISFFAFSEIEIDLLLQYSDLEIIKKAKSRLLSIRQTGMHHKMMSHKSVTDIIRNENLDAPICIISCNITEAIDISRLALKSSIYLYFDGFEQLLEREEDVDIAHKMLGIRRVTTQFGPPITRLNTIVSRKNSIPDGKVFINGHCYRIENDWSIFEMGGEADLHKMESDNRILKLFIKISSNKVEKLKILLKAKQRGDILSAFCMLPDALAETESGECVGYTMEFVDGQRLDRYLYELSGKKETTIADVVEIFLQVALAVHTVHLNDFIIGDLCSNNFMVSGGRITIVDCDSFQIKNYPCDGFHMEACDLEGKFLTCFDDFCLLTYMYESLIGLFERKIIDEYKEILDIYRQKINDISGFIYAFYYFLRSEGRK